ncbi:hypothetical protein CEXT_238071 [Caerostris extrusa]|uniref:Uncharacterized protein n=1 Tax=Caerostris extrusa TaxID=172846 RepID=A0AAV4QQY1_CAEEX|nr:hypothetical protein CEXT_238071 [Caerostris extrusa]
MEIRTTIVSLNVEMRAGRFLLSCCRNYTSHIVKNRDRGGYSQLSANETPVPSLWGDGEQAHRKKKGGFNYYD